MLNQGRDEEGGRFPRNLEITMLQPYHLGRRYLGGNHPQTVGIMEKEVLVQSQRVARLRLLQVGREGAQIRNVLRLSPLG